MPLARGAPPMLAGQSRAAHLIVACSMRLFPHRVGKQEGLRQDKRYSARVKPGRAGCSANVDAESASGRACSRQARLGRPECH